MKKLKYTVEIKGITDKGKEITISTQACSAQELLKNLKDIFDKQSKTCIEKVLGFIK